MAQQYRTIAKAFEQLKKEDPDSDITLTALRRLCVTGVLPTVRIGSKYMLSMNNLHAFFNGELSDAKPEPETFHGIRRISA